jgi:hypothetical protein
MCYVERGAALCKARNKNTTGCYVILKMSIYIVNEYTDIGKESKAAITTEIYITVSLLWQVDILQLHIATGWKESAPCPWLSGSIV